MVLEQTGVTHIIVADMALNDMAMHARSHADGRRRHRGPKNTHRPGAHRGLKIYGATLTPFEGPGTSRSWRNQASGGQPVDSHEQGVRCRDRFDAATRDPKHPARFLPLI